MGDGSVLPNPLVAFGLDGRAAAPGDGPGDATAVLQIGVGGVDDGIEALLGQVTVDQLHDPPLG